MQITGGQFRKLQLQSLPSEKVRPTARRVRERLFWLLGERIKGARFLDLCAGSGVIGIEALSRGAAHTTFIDRSAKACTFICLNLQACGVTDQQCAIFTSTAFKYLRAISHRGKRRWDIVYYDPPYATDYAPVLNLFAAGGLLNPRGFLVVEHHRDQQPEAGGALTYVGTVEMRETCLSFFEQQSEGPQRS